MKELGAKPVSKQHEEKIEEAFGSPHAGEGKVKHVGDGMLEAGENEDHDRGNDKQVVFAFAEVVDCEVHQYTAKDRKKENIGRSI